LHREVAFIFGNINVHQGGTDLGRKPIIRTKCECCGQEMTLLREGGSVVKAACAECKIIYFSPKAKDRAPICPVCGKIAIRVESQGDSVQFFVHEQRRSGNEFIRWGHHAPTGGFYDYVLKHEGAAYDQKKGQL